MRIFAPKPSAPFARPFLVLRRRRNRGRKNPAPKKPLPRRGTDRGFATVAFDVGRKLPKTWPSQHFRKCCARGNPFQTPQRLQDTAKIGPLEQDMRTIRHFIGGREVNGTSGSFADV